MFHFVDRSPGTEHLKSLPLPGCLLCCPPNPRGVRNRHRCAWEIWAHGTDSVTSLCPGGESLLKISDGVRIGQSQIELVL